MRRILAAILLAVSCATAGFAQPAAQDSYENRIESLNKRILRKEIEFERQYLRYRIAGTAEPKTRRMRYFFLQQTATALPLTASIISTAEIGKNLKTPEKIRNNVLNTGYVSGMVGGIIGGSSSAIELSSNAWIAVQNKMHKRDPGSERKIVANRLKEIDGLLAERAVLTGQLPGESAIRKVCESEGRLLKLFRDWCLYEFADVYADIKSNQSSYNVYYLTDIAAQTIAATTYGMATRSIKRPNVVGGASIAGMVGDSLFIIGAPLSTVAASVLYKYYYRKLGKQLGEKFYDPEPVIKTEMDGLNDLLSRTSEAELGPFRNVQVRAKVLELWSDRYDRYIDKRMEQMRHLSKVALQNNVSGPAISANYLAADLMGTIAFYRFKEKPHTATNLFFAGAVASTAASAASLALSTQTLIQEKRFEKQLRAKGALPEQLMEQRLATLADLDKMLE